VWHDRRWGIQRTAKQHHFRRNGTSLLRHLSVVTQRHGVPTSPLVRLCFRMIQNEQRSQHPDCASTSVAISVPKPVTLRIWTPLLSVNMSCPPSCRRLYLRSVPETHPSSLININGGGGG
jgi:hypothetical protein